MDLAQKIKEQYEIGFPIFKKLFQLKKDDFINVMKDIFQDDEYVMRILESKPNITKTLENDNPEQIRMDFYDSILIDHTGIWAQPEHGSSVMILKFDKFFNIDVALNNYNVLLSTEDENPLHVVSKEMYEAIDYALNYDLRENREKDDYSVTFLYPSNNLSYQKLLKARKAYQEIKNKL